MRSAFKSEVSLRNRHYLLKKEQTMNFRKNYSNYSGDIKNNPDIYKNEVAFLSKPISKVLDFVKRYDFLTPNLFTCCSFIFALIAVIFILRPGYAHLLASSVLIIVSYLLDCIDGRLARLKKMETYFGYWLDRITDQVKLSLIILAFGIRARYLENADNSVLIFVSLVIILQLVKEFHWALFEIFRLKISPSQDYGEFVVDALKLSFNKVSFLNRMGFYFCRVLAFLHYEQIFVLGIFPLLTNARYTLYAYGVLSAVSLAGRVVVYSMIYRKKDGQKISGDNSGCRQRQ